MSISNELTSDIAAALLNAENKSSSELIVLKEVLSTVYSTLQQMGKDQNADTQLSASVNKPKTDSPSV